MGKYLVAVFSLLIIVAAGCSDDIDPPNGVSDLPPKPESPRGLTASVGNGRIILGWAISNAAAIDRFVVYFSDSTTTDMMVFDTTAMTSDTVDGLVNGRQYYFRVSAIDTSGIEGDKSSPVAGTPGIFSILIEDGQEFTNTRQIDVDLTATKEVSLVQLSEDMNFTDAHWEIYTNKKTFTLSDIDGIKTVYARFELEAGGNSVDVISDDIALDRTAVINEIKIFIDNTIELTADTLLLAGDTLRFEVHVSEKGTEATVNPAGLGQINLNDFGIGGDNLADDNIYGAEYIIPDETEISDAEIMANFTDAAGNHAPVVKSDIRLSVTSPPTPVSAWGYAISSFEIQLLWTQSDISDFSQYRVFRAACDTLPCPDSAMVISIALAVDSKYLDVDLDANTKYWYWIYTDDTHGNTVRSDAISLQTPENEPPDTLTITANTTSDSLSAKISWAQSAQADDFMAYYILRDIAGLPTYPVDDYTSYPDNLVIEFISNQQTTSFTDNSLPVAGTFYYQVYVVDRQGMVSRSNQVSVNIQ